MFTLQQIIGWLVVYKYQVMLPISIFEGPIITVIGGFLASQGILNIYAVYTVSLAGDIFGDLLYYALGRWGANSVFMKWLKYLGATEERVHRLEAHFKEHSGKTLLIGKISHGAGSLILIAAGAAKMPVGRFIWLNFIGSIPKSLAFVLVGYYFGEAYKRISQYIDYTALLTFGIAVIIIILYIITVRIIKIFSSNK